MLKDAKRYPKHKDILRGQRDRITLGLLVPQDKAERLELLPVSSPMIPRGVRTEGGGPSWHAMDRWLKSKIGSKFKLSEAPKEWQKIISRRLERDRDWLRGGFYERAPWSDCFWIDDNGVLLYFPRKPGPRYKKPKERTLAYEGKKYLDIGGLWYEVTFNVIADVRYPLFFRKEGEFGEYLVEGKRCQLATKRQVNGKLQRKLKCLSQQ